MKCSELSPCLFVAVSWKRRFLPLAVILPSGAIRNQTYIPCQTTTVGSSIKLPAELVGTAWDGIMGSPSAR